jgi:hypothetical protein
MYKFGQPVQKAKRNIKGYIIGLGASLAILAGAAIPTFAATPAAPGSYGTASPNAQCGTAAGSGGYADEYGNFGYLGDSGGANGYQTGLNNSAECGNRANTPAY